MGLAGRRIVGGVRTTAQEVSGQMRAFQTVTASD